jgi:hypothetical protein
MIGLKEIRIMIDTVYIGDRIKVIESSQKIEIEGEIGTVLQIIGTVIAVEFDKKINGHNCGGIGKDRYSYYLEPLYTSWEIIKETRQAEIIDWEVYYNPFFIEAYKDNLLDCFSRSTLEDIKSKYKMYPKGEILDIVKIIPDPYQEESHKAAILYNPREDKYGIIKSAGYKILESNNNSSDYYIDSLGFSTSKKNWNKGLNLI